MQGTAGCIAAFRTSHATPTALCYLEVRGAADHCCDARLIAQLLDYYKKDNGDGGGSIRFNQQSYTDDSCEVKEAKLTERRTKSHTSHIRTNYQD